MLLTAALLAVALCVLSALPSPLARATWPTRAPTLALVLWQSLGLAAGLLLLELSATLALAPYGSTHETAVRRLVGASSLSSPPWLVQGWSLAAAAVGVVVLTRLVTVLVGSTVRTQRARRSHRRLVDLVGTSNPLLRGTSVLDHAAPVAYCLPGIRSRVVLSRGALSRLNDEEVAAVLAHERAHVTQRHDLVVLPFAALDASLPRLRPVRRARDEVALLIEMLADDRAVRDHDRTVLARALYKVGAVEAPTGTLGATSQSVLLRAGRLIDPPAPLHRGAALGAVGASALLFALPLIGLLLPLLR